MQSASIDFRQNGYASSHQNSEQKGKKRRDFFTWSLGLVENMELFLGPNTWASTRNLILQTSRECIYSKRKASQTLPW